MKKDNQKKGQIQEVGGYDDPTGKRVNQVNLVQSLNTATEQIVRSIRNLAQITNDIIVEDELKQKLNQSISNISEKIEGDLDEILNTIKEFYGNDLSNPSDVDLISYRMNQDGNSGIGLNEGKEETLFEWKVNRNINRINELINKTK